MKNIWILLLAVVLVASMSLTLTSCKEEAAEEVVEEAAEEVVAEEKEVYYWVSQFKNHPLFVGEDQVGAKMAADELGVEVEFIGPDEIDMPAFIAAIEQTISLNAAGVMVVGWDRALAEAIDTVYDAGIPIITVDADIPSKRMAFVGSSWYDQGFMQATYMGPLINGQGKVALMGIIGAANTNEATQGFTNYMAANYPDVEVIGPYDDEASNEKAAQVTADLIIADPDIVGFGGFDSSSGPGIAQAVKEADKVGEIIVTCVDIGEQHLNLVKEGVISAAVGQKRIFFGYYGLKILYDINHNGIEFTPNDKAAGITNVPQNVYTGFIVATPENVDTLLETLE